MSNIVTPMLACGIDDLTRLTFPKCVSYKLDGCLALIVDGKVQTRSGKQYMSDTVQELFGKPELNGLVGEIIVGEPNAPDVFNVTSGATRKKSLPEGITKDMFTFYVFDMYGDGLYYEREQNARDIVSRDNGCQVKILQQTTCGSYSELLDMEQTALNDGYEGLIARNPLGKYKAGRATASTQDLVKVKRFVDFEAEIIGFEELMHNNNEQTKDELGHSVRSSHKENLIGADTLGALICKLDNGVEFKVGTGYTSKMRKDMWDNREELIGEYAKVKSFPIGVKDKPRLPVFIGLRSKDDL